MGCEVKKTINTFQRMPLTESIITNERTNNYKNPIRKAWMCNRRFVFDFYE